jgi:hypothetical protein
VVGLSLLLQAALRGLRVRADGERLVVRGPSQEARLASQILSYKAELLTLLKTRPALADLEPLTAKVMLAFGGELLSEGEGPSWNEGLPMEEVRDSRLVRSENSGARVGRKGARTRGPKPLAQAQGLLQYRGQS